MTLDSLEKELENILNIEHAYAPWMAQVIIALPKDPAYRKLDARVREEIESIIAGIE